MLLSSPACPAHALLLPAHLAALVPPLLPPAVTRTQGFLNVQQDEPYGDLLLTRGPYL